MASSWSSRGACSTRVSAPLSNSISLRVQRASPGGPQRTQRTNLLSILDNGLIPGGTKSSRKAVFLLPVMPWVTGHKANFLRTATTFVNLDPAALMRHVPPSTITQSTNGTALVTSALMVTGLTFAMTGS